MLFRSSLGESLTAQKTVQAESDSSPDITMSTPKAVVSNSPLEPQTDLPGSIVDQADQIGAKQTISQPPPSPPKAPTPKPPPVQAARTLAGHDRFLVSRPLGSVKPADFSLGLLLDKTEDPSITALLEGLSRSLVDKKLEDAKFSSQGRMLAEILYKSELALAPKITRLRFSEPETMPGSTRSLALRLFSELGSAEGLVILGSDEKGEWQIEHLDLELDGLEKTKTSDELWDPYGYSRNLLE